MEEITEKKEFLGDKAGEAAPAQYEIIKIRKDKVIKFLKTGYNWLSYIALAFIVFLAVKIRTRNLPGLKDVTTGTWTLGPDLDPFLFLRWAEYIVEHGKLFAVDTMRYVPLFYKTGNELLFHPYMIAWFHKIAVLFGSESVTHSAVLYPVFMFALTVIAFFLLTRIIFIKNMGKLNANIIALIASFFLTVLPIFLPRTIAGIPEKESPAFLFMFLALYFFLFAWKSQNIKIRLLMAILAGFSAGGMALIWGGYNYLFLILSVSIFFAFLLGSVDKKRFYVYLTWIISTSFVMWYFSVRYPLLSLMTRGTVIVAFIILVHFIIFNTQLKKYFESDRFSKFPPNIISIIIAIIILAVMASFVFGFNYVPNTVKGIVDSLISPINTRLIQTVAENRSPFFSEWVGSFGPFLRNIPIFFWLFFLGSIILFYQSIDMLRKKERFYLTSAYIFLVSAITFSKYSGNSRFNGENGISLTFYALGFIIFLVIAGFYYYNYYKRKEIDKLKNFELGFLFVLTFFLLTLVSLRGGIRLVMVLTPSISIIVAYFMVASFDYARKMKGDILKILVWGLAGIIILAGVFSGWKFYNEINAQAAVYIPSIYTQQWQKAMAWVRENTPENAVFGHWWDYGYWLQSIGRRATILDGGNAQGYWNHLMGRYALTGHNEREALEFLYSHNATHFLIDSTDIGKYSAFSSIGSDTNYDRASWLPVFVKDKNQVQETKNSTIFIYGGGTSLDWDIKYQINETNVFLPEGKAGLGAILIEQNSNGELATQPVGIFVYQNQQYRLPLRYAFANGKLYDSDSGIESGVFLMPVVNQDGQGLSIEKDGALIYLSKKTVKSQLARLYLYKENGPYFKLVHSEDDAVVAWLKTQNPGVEDIVLFNGIRGPIRIWEINYPSDIELKDEYLSTVYPTKELELLR